MGISRDGMHKRTASGGRRHPIRVKRKFYKGRQPAMTKLRLDCHPLVREVKCRGGAVKRRALRLNAGCFSWGGENITKRARILNVVYNATSNELVRTNTLVKGAIVQVDAAPFIEYYQNHYGDSIPNKKGEGKIIRTSGPRDVLRKLKHRREKRDIDQSILDQLPSKRLYARISTSPGQVGKADGYILEGPELQFYIRKMRN